MKTREKNVCMSTKTQNIPGFFSHSLTHSLTHFCYWGIVYTKGAFIFPLRFCVAWSFLCSRETCTPDPALSHVLRLLFTLFCTSSSVYLCLSDPRVTPSPASSLPTPYQTRERTRHARMYNSHQFSFSVSPHSRWLMKEQSCCVYYNTISDAVPCKIKDMWHNTLYTILCVLF